MKVKLLTESESSVKVFKTVGFEELLFFFSFTGCDCTALKTQRGRWILQQKMEKLHTAVNFCIRYQKTLGYSIVSLLTIASEQIFSSVAFRCPCNSWNILYGCVFLLVPAILLFLLGYMVNARTWLLLTGSCPQEKKQCCGSWGKGCFYLKVLAPVTASILVAPLTWIAVALLSASFYECAASGSSFIRNQVCRDMDNPEACWELLEKIPCDEKVARQLLNENSTSKGGLVSFRAQSQVRPLCSALPPRTPALPASHTLVPASKSTWLAKFLWSKNTNIERQQEAILC